MSGTDSAETQTRQWTFANPTEVRFGDRQLDRLAEIVEKFDAAPHVAILTGSRAAEVNGSLEAVTVALRRHKSLHIDGIPPEPCQQDVRRVARQIESTKATVIVAIGGGSVMDVAKLASLVAGTSLDLASVMSRETPVARKTRPVIAIPTTAGSGSEVTPFAVAATDDTGLKQSLPTPHNYPDIALVAPRFLSTVPKNVIADSGLDALAHALEALWSVHNNTVSDGLAITAAAMILNNLEEYFNAPEDVRFSSNMAKAAMLAGLAFSNTFTAACHSLSYPLSARFGLSHGGGCALTLAEVARMNTPYVSGPFHQIQMLANLGAITVPEAVSRLRERLPSVRTLASLTPTQQDLDFVANNAFAPLMANNPIALERDAILNLLAEAAGVRQG